MRCAACHPFDGYVLLRSGRKAWYLGKSFQVLFTCAGILRLSLCAGLLMAVPVGYAENRWSLAAQWLSQPGREAAYTVGLGSPSVNPILFQSSYPWRALGMSCCLYLLYGWFLGMLTMLCNLLLPRWLGICLVSLFHLMSVLAVQMGTALAPFSPVRLLLVQNLALARGWGGGTFTGAVALFLGLIALIGAVGYFVARQVDVGVSAYESQAAVWPLGGDHGAVAGQMDAAFSAVGVVRRSGGWPTRCGWTGSRACRLSRRWPTPRPWAICSTILRRLYPGGSLHDPDDLLSDARRAHPCLL